MAAKSTTTGTPVKSWSNTRAGMKLISSGSGLPFQRATDSMSAAVTLCPSSCRSKFSSRIRIEIGSLETSPSASKRWIL